MLGAADEEVWDYARKQGFAVISKDSDFQQRSLLFGHPPKVIWLRIGNCTRLQIIELITLREGEIRTLETDPFTSVLVLS